MGAVALAFMNSLRVVIGGDWSLLISKTLTKVQVLEKLAKQLVKKNTIFCNFLFWRPCSIRINLAPARANMAV